MIGSGSTYSNCDCGVLVGPGSTWANTGTVTINPATPLNFNTSNNFVGFRFLNEITGQINYGWAQIALSGSASSQPRAIVAYLYDNSGASVSVGLLTCVPEPSPLAFFGLMAAGALGLREWRKRRAGLVSRRWLPVGPMLPVELEAFSDLP
jgi:hypothetical protein